MRSPDRLNCDNAERPPCDKDGRITLKLNYGKIPNPKKGESMRPRLPSEPDSAGIDPSGAEPKSP